MEDSILLSIKKMLGTTVEYDYFDPEIVININSVLMILDQLGVGKRGFVITGPIETWTDFLEGSKNLELVKSYVYLKVKLIFDPPTTGVLHEAMERQIQEFEWRLNVQAEGVETIVV